MKLKLFLALFGMFFLLLSPASYASFPVERSTTTIASSSTTSVIKKQKEVLTSPAAASGQKSQLIALLLCFFLGGLGIHRFYLGYTWQGIVQILTFGGLGIWVLIDFVRIILGTLKPKGGEYDKTL